MILTTAISAHREIKRGRILCGTCGTKWVKESGWPPSETDHLSSCRSHLPLHSKVNASDTQLHKAHLEGTKSNGITSPQPPQPQPTGSSSSSHDSRVQGYTVGPERGTGGASGIGSGSGRMDGSGNVFFDCLVCGRAVCPT